MANLVLLPYDVACNASKISPERISLLSCIHHQPRPQAHLNRLICCQNGRYLLNPDILTKKDKMLCCFCIIPSQYPDQYEECPCVIMPAATGEIRTWYQIKISLKTMNPKRPSAWWLLCVSPNIPRQKKSKNDTKRHYKRCGTVKKWLFQMARLLLTP